MVSWTRRITARPCALFLDRDSVEENTDIDITHLYLMISSIRIVYFVFFCIIIPQIKKNYIKGGKILVRTYVFRVKPGTPLAILKVGNYRFSQFMKATALRQVSSVTWRVGWHRGRTYSNVIKCRQLQPLHLEILAKSNQKHLTFNIFTFIYTSDNSISLNVLHVFYLTVRVIRIIL